VQHTGQHTILDHVQAALGAIVCLPCGCCDSVSGHRRGLAMEMERMVGRAMGLKYMWNDMPPIRATVYHLIFHQLHLSPVWSLDASGSLKY
jgi:hypothetical protein